MESGSSQDFTSLIIKSPTDQRDYRTLTLDNGLRCTLIHDSQASQSTAALAVAAGHFQDPDDAHGLAHFLEHMLFLGTRTYPEAAAYQTFMSQHGGHHNAWTGTEFSSYYFSIDPTHFEAALDRFMRFFYEPLFTPEWIDKELLSVESEFQLKRRDELRRLYQVHKATSNPAHPFSKFSVGNLSTLKVERQQSLQSLLQDFFTRWYHAERMTLVLAGPQSLAELAEMAQRHGNSIENRGGRRQPVSEPLYLPEQVGVELHVRPIKEARRLIMAFALPGIDADYACKTTSFIAHLLGYEGPGSLYSVLHRQHLINSLAAGGGISGSNFKDFNINMQLTDTGLQRVDDVVREVFAYIDLIRERGLQDWRYQERQVSVRNAFNFQEPSRTSDIAPQLAINMHHYPVSDLIYGDYRMEGLNHQRAHELLSLMVPANMRLTVIHRDVATIEHEPIYGTDYQLHAISSQRQQRMAARAEHSQAQLPSANPYLREVQQPQPLESDAKGANPQYSSSAAGIHHWHLQDPDFRAPKAHVYCQLSLPNATASARDYAQARLWCELMIDKLNESCYDAEIAGLHFNIYPQQRGITIHTSGYSAGIPRLTENIFAACSKATFDPERWDDLRQKLASNWRSALANKPLNLLFARLNVLLQPYTYDTQTLADAMEAATFSDFEQWRQQLFSEVQANVLTHGDLISAQAQQLTLQLQQWLPALAERSAPDLKPLLLREARQSSNWPVAAQMTTQHSDHAALWLFQTTDSSVASQAAIMLLNHIIGPRIFTELRTERQLGYMVGATYLPLQQYPHLLLYVQSGTHDSDALQLEIRQFIGRFCEQLPAILPAELPQAQRALSQQLTEPDANLRLRSQRLWSSIIQQDAEFQRLNQLATAIDSWPQKQLLQFLLDFLQTTNDQLVLTASPKSFDRTR
ncbi:insulinase family protein [Pseudidiomarina salinarum]|uniref:insulinase family protein n=1 Tax=Pseudidiomarina salinarum TaxID=435908 RepID=UPI00068C052D|nr:insulinase family protein [Pseudidiomarina salinarum]RUO70729.1 peptidase M16 [Pseudidiomarina salinarum]